MQTLWKREIAVTYKIQDAIEKFTVEDLIADIVLVFLKHSSDFFDICFIILKEALESYLKSGYTK